MSPGRRRGLVAVMVAVRFAGRNYFPLYYLQYYIVVLLITSTDYRTVKRS